MALFLSPPATFAFKWPLVLGCDLLVVMRYTVISIKYAYTSKAERRTLHSAPFSEAWALNRSLQVLSSFQSAKISMACAELERLCCLHADLGVRNLSLPLGSNGAALLRARLAFDLRRLGLHRESESALTIGRVSERNCPVTTLVLATRLAVQPTHVHQAGWLVVMLRAFTIVFLLTPFMAPLPVRLEEGSSDGSDSSSRLLWLIPPPFTCPCDAACDRLCNCTPAHWSDGLLLLCLFIPLTLVVSAVSAFLHLAAVESYRLMQSLRLWGKLLVCNGFPRVAYRPRSEKVESGAASYATSIDSTAQPTSAAGDETEADRREELIIHEIVDDDHDADDDEGGGSLLPAFDATAWDVAAAAEGETAESTAVTRDKVAMSIGAASSSLHGRTLEAEAPDGVLGWYIGRSMLLDYGERYRTRMDAYTSCCARVPLSLER